MIKTIAQLRGSICGTQSGTYNYYDVITKTYENTEVIFIFERNYNGVISITDTRETYAIYRTELVYRIINEPENMNAYFHGFSLKNHVISIYISWFLSYSMVL